MVKQSLYSDSKIKQILILLCGWMLISVFYFLIKQSGNTLSNLQMLFAMFTIIWTVGAALYSIIFFIQLVFNKSYSFGNKVTYLTAALWLINLLIAHI